MSIKVLVTDSRQVAGLDFLQQQAPHIDFIPCPTRSRAHELIRDVDVVLGLIDRTAVEAAENLQWVHVNAAGVNHFPLDLMAERNIRLTNGRQLHGDTIGDHVMALILSWSRDLPKRQMQQYHRQWNRRGRTIELAQRVLGIVGLGGIGQQVARRAQGFKMTVLGTRKRPEPVEGVDEVYPASQLHDMLPRCHYLAICCPLTPATHHLIGAPELAALPQGAFVVNIARGEVIDEAALIESLQRGHLGGAGLDVFDPEPLPVTSPLWGMPQVIVTPHVAGEQTLAQEKGARRFLENLALWESGQELKWEVDYEWGY